MQLCHHSLLFTATEMLALNLGMEGAKNKAKPKQLLGHLVHHFANSGLFPIAYIFLVLCYFSN